MIELNELIKYTSEFKVLYVEDDLEMQEKMKELLGNFFMSITSAYDAEEALELYKNDYFDLVLSDIDMPRLNGLDMSRQIKEINSNQAIILVTAFNDTNYLLDSIEMCVDGYILKPFSVEQIVEVLFKVSQRIRRLGEEAFYQKKLEEEVSKITKEFNESKKDLQEQHDRLEAIFKTSKDGIALIDLETNFLDFNDAYLEMTGFTREELLSKSCIGLSVAEEVPKHKVVLKEALKKGFYKNFEKTCIVNNSKKVTVNMSLSLMPNKKEFIAATRDITESNKINKKMKNYMKIIDENIVTSSTNLDGYIIDVSQVYCDLCGYTKEELIGLKHNVLRDDEADKDIYKNLWETIISDKVWRGEIRNKKKNGQYFWVEVSIFPIYNDENIKVGYTSIRQNITDKKNVEKLSITDGLTGIYNRRYFDASISKIINSAKRNNGLVCFMMLDIDYFKLYNDTYGHQKGDDVLISIAKCMKDSLKRVGDHSFRLGGEEFAILFLALNKEDAYLFANSIHKNINALSIPHEKSRVSDTVTVSIGLVCKYAKEIENEETLYKEVDDLLYLAKEQGRNKIVINK